MICQAKHRCSEVLSNDHGFRLALGSIAHTPAGSLERIRIGRPLPRGQHPIHHHRNIHLLASPARDHGVRPNVNATLPVEFGNRDSAESSGDGEVFVHRLARGIEEAEYAVVRGFDAEAALVDEVVMVVAERNEVREPRLAAVGPVPDVVALGIARVRAARESATLVAGSERALERRRNGARAPTHVERLAFCIVDEADERAVAGEPARSFDGERGPVLELAEDGSRAGR